MDKRNRGLTPLFYCQPRPGCPGHCLPGPFRFLHFCQIFPALPISSTLWAYAKLCILSNFVGSCDLTGAAPRGASNFYGRGGAAFIPPGGSCDWSCEKAAVGARASSIFNIYEGAAISLRPWPPGNLTKKIKF